MKIGYLMQHGPDIREAQQDGPSSHVKEVIDELRNRGHEVSVLLGAEGAIWLSDGSSGFKKVAENSPRRTPLGLLESGYRRIQSVLHLPYFNLLDSRRFASTCLKKLGDVDIFFERSSWMGYGGWMASVFSGRPLMMEYNGDPLHDLEAKGMAPEGSQRWGNERLMRRTFNAATCVVATGNGWREQIIEVWGLDPGKVITVENGSSLLKLLGRGDLTNFSPSSGSSKPVEVVYLGGFQPWQGVFNLIEAFDRLVKQDLPLRLLLIGEGNGLERARQDVSARGLSGLVLFTGALKAEEFAPLLARAEIATSPYCNWSEYSGLKLYDYKAAGLAIVASGENGEPISIEAGRNGLIVPPCDTDALEQAIRRLTLNPGLRRQLGQQARQDAERMHGWDQTAKSLEDVMLGVAGSVRSESVHKRVEVKLGFDG